MKNSKVLFLDLVNQIKIDESREEIQTIVYIVLENLFSISRSDIFGEKQFAMEQGDETKINKIVQRINSGEPIQYILDEAEFYGRKFSLNSSVLIPRPETEELVRFIVTHLNKEGRAKNRRMLDIGTGSGCIPITLALEIPGSTVYATDISDIALDVAAKNALRLHAIVQFARHDILKDEIPFQNLDVVVSNPPYIADSEKGTMKNNVLSFEPHLALFVPDEDPLVFYKFIVEKARRALQSGGLLAVEINERFGKAVATLLTDARFENVEVIKDLVGKERIVIGILP